MARKALTPVSPPTLAVAEGASSPSITEAGALIWSSTTSTLMQWNGSNWRSFQALPAGINAQTGTTYTLALADMGKLVQCANASAIAVTVPTNTSIAFPIGTVINIVQDGAGQVTVSGAGTTLRTSLTLKTRGQYSMISLTKFATDSWYISGDVALT